MNAKIGQEKVEDVVGGFGQGWMTNSILELMEERRQHRNTKAIKEAKERWLQEKCVEIEILQENTTALTFIGK